MPAYQAAPFIGATIESVLAQTCDRWELVIVDDASPDDTFAVASGYASDGRIRLERNEHNLGPVGNWNRVVSMASAEYVKVLCDDDLLYPTCLARQAAALDAHPTAGLVGSRRDIVDQDGRVVIRGRGLAGMEGLVPGHQALTRMLETGTTPFGEPSVVLFRGRGAPRGGPVPGPLRHAGRRRHVRAGAARLGRRRRRRHAGRLPDERGVVVGPLAPGAGPEPSPPARRPGARRLVRRGAGNAAAWPGVVVRAGAARGVAFRLAEWRAVRTRR